MRIFDELVRQRRHMHEAVLVHADIDECAEGRDIGHHSFEHHPGVQIGKRLDAVPEGGRLELRTRITAWFFQLREDVAHRRQTEGLVGKFRRREFLQRSRLAP
jgi:hypothetical protein